MNAVALWAGTGGRMCYRWGKKPRHTLIGFYPTSLKVDVEGYEYFVLKKEHRNTKA
jgi:hypothetical protein